MADKTCFVHIGTHKTGSTALQHFLFSNASVLAAQGIYVPVSGRLADSPAGCGHHCLAWDLLGADAADPISGTLERLIAEIQARGLPVVCLSSEELEHLHLFPNRLQRLRAGLAGIGYRTILVVYLRPQADYLEALYAEVGRHAPVRDFWSCYREVLKHGAVDLWPGGRFTAMFDYRRLVAPFVPIVGRGNIIVRPFRRYREPGLLVEDFMRVVGGRRFGLTPGSRHDIEWVNTRATFSDIFHAIDGRRRQAGQTTTGPPAVIEALDGPFDPLRLHEIVLIARRFALSNLALALHHRVFIGGASWRQFGRALRASLSSNQPKRRRIELLRRVFEPDATAARD
jgi:hypothetical protein